ncbi:5'-3' exonuclease H3TH domain-containing protein [uncultured Endozoicomonas sp.]|uniref:5'-3' exonuclease H3TH domain-containing protein n=1 Tax=uncultured Endozoicomonas sp. TaxID=432652 RepID=UPI002632205F|nr:5'-3' exonuclease H3TH domain-containing protein [uncultured Endozoicomonas sp.]
MAPTLLLIDALNLIRRIHAAVPGREAPNQDNHDDEAQQVEGALSATVSSVQRAIKECNPTHALVVFDGDPPTWRHELLPDYKAKRKPMPDALRRRLSDFNKAFREMGLMTFRRNGVEADDVIGAITHKAIAGKINTIILSTDKAYRQLLQSPLVIQRDHFQKLDFDRAEVMKEFGIQPEQLLDYWSMAGVGDIPGVDGVGKKGAGDLLAQFGNLQNLFSEGSNVEAPKGPLKKVLNQKEHALLSLQMATLKEDIDLGMSLKEMRYLNK